MNGGPLFPPLYLWLSRIVYAYTMFMHQYYADCKYCFTFVLESIIPTLGKE